MASTTEVLQSQKVQVIFDCHVQVQAILKNNKNKTIVFVILHIETLIKAQY